MTRVLLNAMHTTSGGGVTYLRGILPELARDERWQWQVLLPAAMRDELTLPRNMQAHYAPAGMSFWQEHAWEQLVLPFLARRWGVRAVLCNASYVPLLAPRPMPILHVTLRAAEHDARLGMRIYWWCLRQLAALSLWRAPVSFALTQQLAREYGPEKWAKNVRIVYPAVDVSGVPSGAVDKDLVVAVGDFYPHKNYPLLLHAFKMLREQRPGTRLLIVGKPIDVAVRDEVLHLVRELGIADAVTLTGAVPHARLLQTMRKAAVYVSTSAAESFHIPVLEALTLGVPCVLPEVEPYVSEVAGPAAVYFPLTKGGDVPAALAVALFGVLQNPAIADTLRRNGKARAGQFGWDKTAAVIGAGLAQVLGDPRTV